MTFGEFLEWEQGQSGRWEFVAGEVFAMTGGTMRHNTVALNVAVALRRHLHGSGCRVFINDVMLRVDAVDASYYPDVMVTCSAADLAAGRVAREPTLLVEVLSPSTEKTDRGEKFAAYRRLPALRELVFVDPVRRICEVLQILPEGRWSGQEVGPRGTLRLTSVGLDIDADALWADLDADDSAGAGVGDRGDAPPA